MASRTRARILRLAAELHYRADPMVSALMRRRRTGRPAPRHVVQAFVTGFPTAAGWRAASPMFPAYFAGASRRAEQRGYRLEEFWKAEGISARRFAAVLANRGVPGLLLAPAPDPVPTLDPEWTRFCAVGLGLTQPGVNRAAHDHVQGARLAVSECRRRGYRRIGLAMSSLAHRKVEGRWLAGYLLACREFGLDESPPPLIADRWQESAVHAWWRRERPDAILSTHPRELGRWLARWGGQPPRGLGLVNLSGSAAESYGDPFLHPSLRCSLSCFRGSSSTLGVSTRATSA